MSRSVNLQKDHCRPEYEDMRVVLARWNRDLHSLSCFVVHEFLNCHTLQFSISGNASLKEQPVDSMETKDDQPRLFRLPLY